MKKLLLAAAAVIGLSAGQANAGLLLIEGVGGGPATGALGNSVAFTTPGPGATPGFPNPNDIIPGVSGFIGAALRATANVALTYEYLGKEAGFTNLFFVDGVQMVNNQTTAVGVTRASSAAAGSLLNFQFRADTGGVNATLNNVATGVNVPADFFLGCVGGGTSCDSVYIALDDGGQGANDNHDDLVIKVTARLVPVPEPASLALLGAGLLGLGVAARRRRKV